MALRKYTDDFGQEWTDWLGAATVDPMSRRIMVREAIDSLRQRRMRGEGTPGRALTTFVTSGEALYTVELHADNTVAVHACKVLAHTWDYK